MDFECYKCNRKFGDLNVAIKHLKDTHLIKDNTCKIKCLVKFAGHDGCDREYLSFRAMRNHAEACMKKRPLLPTSPVITHEKFTKLFLRRMF